MRIKLLPAVFIISALLLGSCGSSSSENASSGYGTSVGASVYEEDFLSPPWYGAYLNENRDDAVIVGKDGNGYILKIKGEAAGSKTPFTYILNKNTSNTGTLTVFYSSGKEIFDYIGENDLMAKIISRDSGGEYGLRRIGILPANPSIAFVSESPSGDCKKPIQHLTVTQSTVAIDDKCGDVKKSYFLQVETIEWSLDSLIRAYGQDASQRGVSLYIMRNYQDRIVIIGL